VRDGMAASSASCASRRCEMAWQHRRHLGARPYALAASRRRRVARGPAATYSSRPGGCVWRRKRRRWGRRFVHGEGNEVFG
jgi:hypothetical protein